MKINGYFLFIFKGLNLVMGLSVLFVCMYACIALPGCSAHTGQKRATDLPGTGVTEGCELPRGCLRPSLCPLQGQQVFSCPLRHPSDPKLLFLLTCMSVCWCVESWTCVQINIELRKEYCLLWSESYRWFWIVLWTKLRFPRRAIQALNHFPDSLLLF